MIEFGFKQAQNLTENQDPVKRKAIALARKTLRDFGVTDPKMEASAKHVKAVKVEMPVGCELDLEAEWQRQSENFLRLVFHIETGFDDTDEGRQAFLEALPKFKPQPAEYKGKFDVPLLVIKKIPWEIQARLAGISISDYLRERINSAREWEDNPSKIGDIFAYTGWFNSWGQRFPEKIKPFDARKQLTRNEGAGGPKEGVSVEVNRPEFTANGNFFDLIDESVGSDDVVYLDRWHGRPWLDAGGSDGADDDFRPLVRGSKVVTK